MGSGTPGARWGDLMPMALDSLAVEQELGRSERRSTNPPEEAHMKLFIALIIAALSASLPTRAQTPPDSRHRLQINSFGECEVFANADNHYTLYVNGEKVMEATSFNTTQSKKITLYKGDVITVYGKN